MTWSFRHSPRSPVSRDTVKLFAAMTRLDGALHLDTLRQQIGRAFTEATGTPQATLFDRRYRSGPFYTTHLRPGPDLRPAPASAEEPSGQLSKWLSANSACIAVPQDTTVLAYLPPSDLALFREYQTRLVVPLLADGRLCGILFLSGGTSADRPNEQLLTALVDAGALAAAALERAHAHDAERERLRALHRAQQLTITGRLAAEVAHEIRNPLAAIRLTIQSVLDDHDAWESRAALLEQMLAEVDRIQNTVSRLLNIGRPDDLILASANLSEIAQTSVELIRSLASRQQIRIDTDLDQPLHVRADRGEMQKVFLNLLMNACQAMPSGGAIHVASAVIAGGPIDPRPIGRITITDTGPGVDAGWLNRPFEPFFTTKASGTGLGLAVSLDIVTRQDGTLELASPPGGGAVATVTLPLRDERESP